MRASVQDDRRVTADREPRAVFAVPQDDVPGAVAPWKRPETVSGRATGRRVAVSTNLSVLSLSTNGERAVVRAEGEAGQPVAVAAQHADRRRVLEQRGEQVAARLRASRAAPRPGGRAAARGLGGHRRAPARRGAAPPPRSPRHVHCRAGRARSDRRSLRAPAARPRPPAPCAGGAARARSPAGCHPGTRARSR